MEKNKKLIFVSQKNWKEFIFEGFRTRSGCMLSSFIQSGYFKKIYLFVNIGFRGFPYQKVVSEKKDSCEIIEIGITSWLPETAFLPIYNVNCYFRNTKLPKFVNELVKLEKPDFIWTYHIGIGQNFMKSLNIPLFYDVIDFRINDSNLVPIQKLKWKKELNLAAGVATVVSCNGDVAFAELQKKTKKLCVIIRNGVDPKRFKYAKGLKREGVGFVGVLSKSTDFKLIEKMLKNENRLDFHFFGRIHLKEISNLLSNLCKYSNFHWHGELKPVDLPEFFAKCNVSIIPYDPKRTWDTLGDSMKIFESLAAGTPVVATNFQLNLREKFDDLITVCDTHEEFIAAVAANAVRSPNKIWQDEAWSFVQKNSWMARVDQVLELADRVRSIEDNETIG